MSEVSHLWYKQVPTHCLLLRAISQGTCLTRLNPEPHPMTPPNETTYPVRLLIYTTFIIIFLFLLVELHIFYSFTISSTKKHSKYTAKSTIIFRVSYPFLSLWSHLCEIDRERSAAFPLLPSAQINLLSPVPLKRFYPLYWTAQTDSVPPDRQRKSASTAPSENSARSSAATAR